MIGIVVPAHDEEYYIGPCVKSLMRAAKHPRLQGEAVFVIVVLDTCTDSTERIVRELGVACAAVEARNVGVARAKGAELALHAGARWLAFTDADTVVAPDWLYAHVSQGSDAVCGTVEVNDWGLYGDAAWRKHLFGYGIGLNPPNTPFHGQSCMVSCIPASSQANKRRALAEHATQMAATGANKSPILGPSILQRSERSNEYFFI